MAVSSFHRLNTSVNRKRLTADGAPSLFVCAAGNHLPVSREEVRELALGRIPPPQLTASITDRQAESR
jgi:hypothetical protein